MILFFLFAGSQPVDSKKDEELTSLNDRLQNLSLQLSEKNSYIEKLVSILVKDILSIFLHILSYKQMLWVFIRICSIRLILVSNHNVFHLEIRKKKIWIHLLSGPLNKYIQLRIRGFLWLLLL